MKIAEAGIKIRTELGEFYDEGESSSISDWIIEHLTGLKRTDRLSQNSQQLSSTQIEKLNEILSRLQKYEPLQYVLGEAWFCGMKFHVDNNVLIPRPETEELVEWVIANCRFPIDKLSILDVGCGSGCISIALKRRLGKAQVYACDVSEGALSVAARNAASLGADVNFVQVDFLDKSQRATLPAFDIIISNPPYIPFAAKKQMPINVTGFEPSLALFVPDEDPLVFYKAIADFSLQHLNKNGTVYAEVYEQAGETVLGVFTKKNYTAELKLDMSGKQRMVKASK